MKRTPWSLALLLVLLAPMPVAHGWSDKDDSTTTLDSSANPSIYGDSVTFTATVTGGGSTPTGAVEFQDGGVVISECGTPTLDGSGQATCSISSLAVGSHSITAFYTGDDNYNTSTSPTLTQEVNKADTTTTLGSSANPSIVGDSVTFTATVTGGSNIPTGTVEFQDGGVAISDCGTPTLDGSGEATCATSSLTVGSHSITAVYSGDDNNNTSTSPTPTQEVNKADTTTELFSSANPSIVGDLVTFTVNVTGGISTPTGTVEFQDGGVVISDCGTPALDAGGGATCDTSSLTVGSHSIAAVYSGDDNNNTSTSPTLTQEVNKADTTTTLDSSANPSIVGDSVTFTATVTGGSSTPTGTVEFQDGGVAISGCGTQALDGSGEATCATSSLTVGAHSITAVYSGDDNFNTSTSPTLTQDVNKADTTTTLGSSLNPSVAGDSVTFTATVTGGGSTPTGTVEFRDGGTGISGCASVSLSVGQATCSTSALRPGMHAITAIYSGDTSYGGSTGTLSPDQQVNCLSAVTVMNNNDSGAGSLRQAIADVCVGGTITFDSSLSGATITLASALEITNSLTITGPGAAQLSISGNHSTRVFRISGGNVSISGLTIKNGELLTTYDTGAGVLICGSSRVTIDACVIDGCRIPVAESLGGAIFVEANLESNNTLVLTNSAVINNQAERGGAIMINRGIAYLENCTVSGNYSGGSGAGGGGVVYNQTGIVTIVNCTITSNTSRAYESGLYHCTGDTYLKNTIVAGNDHWDVSSRRSTLAITSQGYNVIGALDSEYSNYTPTTGDQIGTSVLLGPLQDNGGPTPTHALLPGSSAIDAIPGCNGAPATDQRGILRPQGSSCDAGAFESRGFSLESLTGTPQSAPINTGFATPLGLSVTSSYGEPVNGGRVLFAPPLSGASATITGSPATISGGTASVTAAANDTIGGPYTVTASATGAASANFSLTNTPAIPPAITSAHSTAFTVGVPGTFTVTTTGLPIPSVSQSGTSPSGVTFTDNHDGTATIGGTPASGSSGIYPWTITATNGVGTDATQNFTLTVYAGMGFYAVTPCRVFDTRDPGGPTSGNPLGAGESLVYNVTTKCGISATAKAIAANVTVANATTTGELEIVAGDQSSNAISIMPVPAARARANNATIQLAIDGAGTVRVINHSSGTVHVILDVNGYFE